MDAKVYDTIWAMVGSEPREFLVFAVVKSMAFRKGGEIATHYQLVEHQAGAGWGNNEGMRRDPDEIFATKDELLAAFVSKHSR